MICSTQSENLSLYSFNLLSSKQANNIMSLGNEMNEYQVMLFDFMNSLPLADNLKDELHKWVLASQVQNAPDFITAKNVLFKIAMDIKEGVLTVASTLRAVFVERLSIKTTNIEEMVDRERPVPFYNWLNERDDRIQINSRPNFENWLEW